MIEKKKTNADKIRSMTDEELANLLSTAWNKADYDDDDYDPAWLEWLRMSPEEAQEFAKVKADGRLVVLPCKVGTRVWVIGQNCDMCCDMYAEEPCLFGDCEYKGVFESIFSIGMTDKFGKTVFLTREEAEKALEGLK